MLDWPPATSFTPRDGVCEESRLPDAAIIASCRDVSGTQALDDELPSLARWALLRLVLVLLAPAPPASLLPLPASLLAEGGGCVSLSFMAMVCAGLLLPPLPGGGGNGCCAKSVAACNSAYRGTTAPAGITWARTGHHTAPVNERHARPRWEQPQHGGHTRTAAGVVSLIANTRRAARTCSRFSFSRRRTRSAMTRARSKSCRMRMRRRYASMTRARDAGSFIISGSTVLGAVSRRAQFTSSGKDWKHRSSGPPTCLFIAQKWYTRTDAARDTSLPRLNETTVIRSRAPWQQ